VSIGFSNQNPLKITNPQRQYTWTGIQPNDMGRRGESYVGALLASRERGDLFLRKRGVKKLSLEEYIAYLLKEIEVIETFVVEEIKQGTNIFQVKVRKNNDSTPVLITGVGCRCFYGCSSKEKSTVDN
jgi:hypothetical protein